MVTLKKPIYILTLIASVLFSIPTFATISVDRVATHTQEVASEEVHEGEETHKKEALTPEEERAEFIDHHLLDSHDFHLFSYGEKGHEKHVGFSLPVILWADGLHVFSSSKFDHEKAVAESNGKYFKIEHGLIYETDKNGNIEHEAHGNPLKRPIDLSITKNVFMMIVVSLLMFWLFVSLAKSYAKNNGIAKGAGRFFEPIVLYIRDDIAIPNIGEKHYKKYMPFLLTVFFFVWFLNMFGLTPLGVNVTGNLAVTAGLAILTYLIKNF